MMICGEAYRIIKIPMRRGIRCSCKFGGMLTRSLIDPINLWKEIPRAYSRTKNPYGEPAATCLKNFSEAAFHYMQRSEYNPGCRDLIYLRCIYFCWGTKSPTPRRGLRFL